ncbi:proton-conducting transporter membrane subunit, partial [Limnoraphis robusta CCNP1324]|uniref:proton-conducting transporter transmembrane domain-containing protein n=1 Tax=Limnoraphis robusta TaxID=1118279 RepID=UPI002B1FFCBB
KYGNLRKYLPVTFATFFIGWLAIAGVPPLSGFWSKDEILAGAWSSGPSGKALWVIGIIVAALTAFYMTRQLIMTFYGDEKWRIADPRPEVEAAEDADVEDAPAIAHASADGHDDHHHLTPEHTPRESPWTMLAPLVVLAGFAVVAGVLNLPFSKQFHRLENWLHRVIVYENALPNAPVLFGLASGAITTAVIGIWFGYWVYSRRKVDAAKIEKPVLAHAWYIDETYAKVAGGPGEAAFQGVS